MAESAPARPRRRLSGALLLVALAIVTGVVAVLRERPVPPLARAVALHERPRAIPDFAFEDGEGRRRTLADWRGRVVVLNLWATWCAPCRVEMPSLQALQKALADAPVDLVPLSVDEGGRDAIERYYRENGLGALRVYRTSFATAQSALGASGIPVTIIVDREGHEAGRVVGENAWDREEVAELLRALAARAPATTVDRPTVERLPIGPLLR